MAKRVLILFHFALLSLVVMASASQGDIEAAMMRMKSVPGRQVCDRAYDCIQRGETDSAFIYYSIVVNRYDFEGNASEDDCRNAVTALTNLATLCMTYDFDMKKAYGYLLRAQALAEKHHFDSDLSQIYIGISNVYSLMGGKRHSQSEVIELTKKAFRVAVRAKDYNQVTTIFSNLVSYAISIRNHKSIDSEYKLYQKMRFPAHTELVAFNRCLVKSYGFYVRRQYVEAAKEAERAARSVDAALMKERFRIFALSIAADIYMQCNDLNDAERLLREQQDLAGKDYVSDFLPGVYSDLRTIYQARQMPDSVRKYDYLRLKYKDSLNARSNAGGVDDVKFLYDLDTANGKMRDMADRHRLQTIVLGIVALALIVVTILLVRLARSNRRVRQSHDDLYRANLELLAEEEEMKQRMASLREASTQDPPKEVPSVRYQKSNLSSDDAKRLYQKIVEVLETAPEIYSSDFSLDLLSKQIGSNSSYVSQAINSETGKNFTSMLNRYRIREACRRLNDQERYGSYTLETIAESVGFKSRNAFTTNFKQHVGLTPSEYLRRVKKNQLLKN